MALVPTGAAWKVCWDWSLSGLQWVGWGRSSGECEGGACSARRVGAACLHWFPKASSYLGSDWGWAGNGSCWLFCSWASFPKIRVPPSHILRLVNKCSSCIPQVLFQTAFSMLLSEQVVCYAGSKRIGTQVSCHPLALLEPNLLIFKVPRVKPH